MVQQEIADMLSTSQKRISRIENDEDEFNEYELNILKEYFDIVGMPLTAFECETFKGSLYAWRDTIRAGRLEEAKEMQDELCKAVNLDPCDDDLPILYRLFEILLFIAEGNLNAAADGLHSLENSFDKMTQEHQYYHHFHMGALHVARKHFEDAISCYTNALDILQSYNGVLPDSEEKVYYNLVVCYTEIERPSHAIVFLSEIPKSTFENKLTTRSLGIDVMRATNYYKIGLYGEAEKVLRNCFSRATSIKNDFYAGLSLCHLGTIQRRLGNWNEAIGYFDRAIDILIKDKHHANYRIMSIYLKFRCMIELRKFSDVEKELAKAKSAPINVEGYLIYLEALKHIMHLNKNMSYYNINAVNYLVNTAIPRFISRNNRFEALDCYKLLERHENKSGTIKKALEVNRAMLAIRERMV